MAFTLLKRERKTPTASVIPDASAAPAPAIEPPPADLAGADERAAQKAVFAGAIDGWARVSDRPGYLIDGWCNTAELPAVQIESDAGSQLAVVAWCLRFPRPDAESAAAAAGIGDQPLDRLGFVLFVPDENGAAAPASTATLDFAGTVLRSAIALSESTDRAHSLIELAWSAVDARAGVPPGPLPPEVLAALPAQAPAADLSSPSADPVGHIDGWSRVRARPGYLVEGWSLSPEPSITLIYPDTEGLPERQAPVGWMLRYPRPDVVRFLGLDDDTAPLGFVLFVAEDADSPDPSYMAIGQGKERQYFAPLPPQALDGIHQVIAAQWQERGAWVRDHFGATPPPEILAAVARPPAEIDSAAAFHIDRAAEVPGVGVLLDGWMVELGSIPAHLILVDEDCGQWVDLSSLWHRTERPDVSPAYTQLGRAALLPGFVALAPLPGLAGAEPGAARTLIAYVIAGENIAIQRLRVEPAGQPMDRVRAALGTFRAAHAGAEDLIGQHIGPAIAGWLRHRPSAGQALKLDSYGQVPPRPQVSIVVPLWGRDDLVRVQLARLAGDAAIRNTVELIYVVDDPRLVDQAWLNARLWLAAYGLPLRLAATAGNTGYVNTVNLGSRLARGEYLLLLDADCLPAHAGWLTRLLRVLQADARCGAVGPKLLFADDSVQSAGLAFGPHPRHPQLTAALTPGRGQLDRPGPREAAIVDAVSGACLLTRRQLFADTGGFESGALFGHHEDAMYCHRLAGLGLHTRLLASERLHHLEGLARTVHQQSEPLIADPAWKTKVDLYNAWFLSRQLGAAGEPA